MNDHCENNIISYQLLYSYTPHEHDSCMPLIRPTVPDFYRWRNAENNSVLTITKIKTGNKCKTACRIIRNTVSTTAVSCIIVLHFSARTFGHLNSSPEISGHAFHRPNPIGNILGMCFGPLAGLRGPKKPEASVVSISQFLDHLGRQLSANVPIIIIFFHSRHIVLWYAHQMVRMGHW